MDIFTSVRSNDTERLKKELLTISPNIRDANGNTPLILATYYNYLQCAAILVEAGASIDYKDSKGNTALMGICFKGYFELAEMLIKAGADLGIRNENGATALTFAATFGQLSIVSLLLKHGADPLSKDRFNKNPIDYARIQENEQCYEIMVASINSLQTQSS